MASDLRIRIGNVSAMISLNGSVGNVSDAQVADALRRFATSLGIPITGTPTENLTAILEHIKDDVKRRSRQTQRSELTIQYEQTIIAQIDADNDL